MNAKISRFLSRTLLIEKGELRQLLAAFFYFFLLLCSYYILRPIRDTLGIAGGSDRLPWLFSGTFLFILLIAPLYGWYAHNKNRQKLISRIYFLFIVQLLIFFILIKLRIATYITGLVFFIWLSAFNLFVISVFWSLMLDIFTSDQAKRLFGIIAAGGSCGAIAGPAITTFMLTFLDVSDLFLITTVLLLIATRLIRFLEINNTRLNTATESNHLIGGNSFSAFKSVINSRYQQLIALFIIIYTGVSTIFYFEQAKLLEQTIEHTTERIRYFSVIDLSSNSLTLLVQFLISGRLFSRFKLGLSLLALPVLSIVAFLGLTLENSLISIAIIMICYRSLNFSMQRPSRELLYQILDQHDRFKSKNLVDTVIYRGGDAMMAWLFSLLVSFGLSLAGIAAAALPLAIIWIVLGRHIAMSYQEKQFNLSNQLITIEVKNDEQKTSYKT